MLLEEELSPLLLKRAIVKVDDSLDLCLSPIKKNCSTQEVRGPACYFESQKDQLFSSSSTFQDGKVIGCVTPAVETGLGSDHSPSGCLPSCPDSSSVQTASGFLPSGNLLPVPGSSFRTSGLSLGVLPLGSGRLCIDSLHLIHSNLAS